MIFINYDINFTTFGRSTVGNLLVRDAITLTFNDEKVYKVVVYYSPIGFGFGRMIVRPHKQLENIMEERHKRFMSKVNEHRSNVVITVLDSLKGEEFKDLLHFIQTYNNKQMERGS